MWHFKVFWTGHWPGLVWCCSWNQGSGPPDHNPGPVDGGAEPHRETESERPAEKMKWYQINASENKSSSKHTHNKTTRPQALKHLKVWKFFFPIMNSEVLISFSADKINTDTHFFSQGSHLPRFGCSWGSAGGSRRARCQPMERRYAWAARRVSWATRAVPTPHGSGWWRSCDRAATGSSLVCCPPAGTYRHASGNDFMQVTFWGHSTR